MTQAPLLPYSMCAAASCLSLCTRASSYVVRWFSWSFRIWLDFYSQESQWAFLIIFTERPLLIHVKKSQDYVKIGGFYRPSHTRPILTQGIQICSQKWSQVNISIGYGYISQVKILYKVKFSKLEICQSDCRFKILGKNYQKKVSFFFWNFEWNIVKISVKHPK